MAAIDKEFSTRQLNRRRLAFGVLVVPLIVLVWRSYDVLLGENFAVVTTDQVYRSSQLNAPALRKRISRHQLRSVINLRGRCDQEQWYRDEIVVCHETNTKHYDITLSATAAPDVTTIQELIRILQTSPKPVLIHCKNGADRTGLACAIWLLSSRNANPQHAAQQGLALWHGHIPIGPTTAMDRSFDSYVESNPLDDILE